MNHRIHPDTTRAAAIADAELGPGYMLRDDCEHLARRFLASDWLAAREAAARAEGAAEALREFADTRGVNVGDEDDDCWECGPALRREAAERALNFQHPEGRDNA